MVWLGMKLVVSGAHQDLRSPAWIGTTYAREDAARRARPVAHRRPPTPPEGTDMRRTDERRRHDMLAYHPIAQE
jgi:hypothetical protein